ncbi:MAG: DEAD/DEAH box helicase [Candidatus Odinarchaeota archaeon]|nr:DEAD/DEAH box helicase [Candidatus Odinarchaeota archaeon]
MKKIKFENFDNISTETINSLGRMGYVKPSEIQAKVIPVALKGADVIGQAKTGSGKTAAFGVPLIERIDPKKRKIQAVIMTPTRELAIQVTRELEKIGEGKNIRAITIYGGQSIEIQFRKLAKKPHIIVCTPGRLIDHLNRGSINLSEVSMLVIDEADKMLEMGFIEDLEIIMRSIPHEYQKLLFSATMPVEIMKLSRKYLRNPEVIHVSSDDMSVKHIKQIAYKIPPKQKFRRLLKILRENKNGKILIFTNTKAYGERLKRKIQDAGFYVKFMSGDLTQSRREKTIEWFKQPGSKILVASDVASRGLNIIDVDMVINYDFPKYELLYVHRIGRTGRFGRSGLAVSFVEYNDESLFDRIYEKNRGMKVITVRGYDQVDTRARDTRHHYSTRRNSFADMFD